MFGHRKTADLTHAMESLLDLVRQGKMAVNTPVIDSLLRSLDLLKVLKDDLVNDTDSNVNIAPAVKELEEAMENPERADQGKTEQPAVALTLDQTSLQRLQKAPHAEWLRGPGSCHRRTSGGGLQGK